jgi:hypothetical protein
VLHIFMLLLDIYVRHPMSIVRLKRTNCVVINRQLHHFVNVAKVGTAEDVPVRSCVCGFLCM